jgi:hypothetical protein
MVVTPSLKTDACANPTPAIRRLVTFPRRTDLAFEELDQFWQPDEDFVDVIRSR